MQNLTAKDILEDEHVLKLIIQELSNDEAIKDLKIKLLDGAANKLDCLLSINPLHDNHNLKVGYQGIIKEVVVQKRQ